MKTQVVRLAVCTAVLAGCITTQVLGADRYEIEAAVNDEKFIINGESFEAKTYCLGW
jgi:hypothetical protein